MVKQKLWIFLFKFNYKIYFLKENEVKKNESLLPKIEEENIK